jgi:mono/diheme cytochrome c family protein
MLLLKIVMARNYILRIARFAMVPGWKENVYRGAKDLTTSPFGYDDIIQMVREGSKGKMPGYTVTLSDDEIASVSKFVQNLKTPMGPQE